MYAKIFWGHHVEKPYQDAQSQEIWKKEGKKEARGRQTDLKPDPGRTELLSLARKEC